MKLLAWIGLTALFAVLASLFAEFYLDHAPCLLCWIQRGLWIALLPVSLMGIGRNFRRLAKWIAALLIALNGLAALYHTLVQYKVLEDRCKTTFRISDAAEYAALLGEKKETGCSKKSWTVGKIPAPFLNGAVCAWLLFRIYRDRD